MTFLSVTLVCKHFWSRSRLRYNSHAVFLHFYSSNFYWILVPFCGRFGSFEFDSFAYKMLHESFMSCIFWTQETLNNTLSCRFWQIWQTQTGELLEIPLKTYFQKPSITSSNESRRPHASCNHLIFKTHTQVSE